jgi:hypothetical protein
MRRFAWLLTLLPLVGCVDLTRTEEIRIRKDPPPEPVEAVAAAEPAPAGALPDAAQMPRAAMPGQRPAQAGSG